MIMAGAELDNAARKQLLNDPRGWVRNRGVVVGDDVLAGLLAQREQLRSRLRTVGIDSRQLSKAIGAAKAAGASCEVLLEQKRVISAAEKELRSELKERENAIVALLTMAPAGNDEQAVGATTTDPSVRAVDIDAVEIAAVAGQPGVEWDEFVQSHPDASVYHLRAFKRIVEDTFGHDTFYLQARGAGRMLGVLPLVRLNSRLFGDFLVSMPFFNYGGVLAYSDEVAGALLQRASDIAAEKGCSHIEYRDLRPRPGAPVREDKVAMWLELPPTEDECWAALGSKVRSQIKRAGRFGLTVRTGGHELLDDFYRVFSCNMRDLGTPVYDRQFFHNVMTSPLPDKRLVVVRHDGAPVSAALLIGFRGRMEVPWASTLRSANRFDANMLLYWELLKQACQSGYCIFDFGRSTRDAPTYRFKKQWGAEPRQLYWHYWLASGGEPPKLNPDNPKYRAVIALWQRLPVWLTRLVGPRIVKYLP